MGEPKALAAAIRAAGATAEDVAAIMGTDAPTLYRSIRQGSMGLYAAYTLIDLLKLDGKATGRIFFGMK